VAYPTYRQDFEGGSTLATACPELTDSSTSPPGWSIDTTSKGFTGANSLLAPIRTANSLIASGANDTLGGNVSISAYIRSLNGGGTGPIREYRVYGRATGTALATGYFVDVTSTGLIVFGQVSGSTTFGPIGGGAGAGILPNNVVVLGQVWLSGTSPVTVKACAIRQDTGQFWSNASGGSWVSTPTYITGTDSTGGINTGAGLVGISHRTDNTTTFTETANYTDDLIYEPATQQIDLPTVTLTSASPTQQLTAGGFTDPLFGVTWSSSNPAVATASGTGLVASVGIGTATITATGKRDTGQTATCSVTVASLPVFLYRIPVTIDNTANTTSALAYHQVTIALAGAAYTSINTHAKADRSDLRVFDSDGVTPLSFALEGNDTANGVVYLLVKVPRVAAAGTRTIYVYYGNATAGSVSSYASTIGANAALIGPVDVTITGGSGYSFTDSCGTLLCLKNQGGSGGGGAGLNGRILGFGSNGATGNAVGFPNLIKYTSTDGGATFTSGVLIANDGVHASMPRGAVELADGTILLCYTYDIQSAWVAGKASFFVGKSNDGGVTWSNVSASPTNRVAVPYTYGADLGTEHGALIEKTPGGDIYMPVYGHITADTGWHSWLLKCPSGSSPTNGSNWVVQGTIAFDNVNQFNETAVVQTSDSSHYLAVMRNETTGDLHMCTSADSGVTWTAAPRMNLPGIVIGPTGTAVSPALLKLQSGNYSLSWGVRYGDFFGCVTALSTDGGVNWLDRAPAILQATPKASQVSGNYGYSSPVQRPDGVIVANLFHQVAGPSTNIGIVTYTEDWICNSPNVYEACESLAGFSSVGANATLDAAHVHNGTRAVKIDNSAATGGINDYILRNAWSTNTALQVGKVALSYWSYETANDSSRGLNVKDSTGVATGTTGGRFSSYVLGTTSDHITWFDGTHHDTGVPVPANQWAKLGFRLNIQAASVAGEIRLGGVSVTTSVGQFASGGAPQQVQFQGGSTAATHSVIFWLDDLYTHQYTANVPVVTAAAEQTGPFGGSCPLVGGGLVGGSLINEGLVI